MGNTSSSTSSKKSGQKTHFLCCPCTLSKSLSSSSLSSDEKYLPTFDRIASNTKTFKSPLQTQPSPSKIKTIDDQVDHNLSSSNNRRSVSLHNVILTLPTNENQEKYPLHSKPPLPTGKSMTVAKLPPTGRSFRGTLATTKRTYYSQSIKHARLSIEDLEKSLQGSASIDHWIDSLPILGTPSLNRNKTTHSIRTVASTNNKKIKRSLTIGDEYNGDILNGSYRQEPGSSVAIEPNLSKDDYPNILSLKSNREFLNFAKQIQLNTHVKDFLSRLKHSKSKQTFKNHFSLSTIIYPLPGMDHILADDLHLFLLTPSECILPDLSSNSQTTYKLHEQIRSKCYFIPQTNWKIEADDEEYQRKSIELDRTHVVITIENKTKDSDGTIPTKKVPIEEESSGIFVSNDSFQTGFLRIDQAKLAKPFLPFVFHSSEENGYYLSSNLIQQWFQTLILVNQTCSIAKRFLTGDGSHITCLIKQQINSTNSLALENNLTFAALRLPPCMYLNDCLPATNPNDEELNIIDAFSPAFLSDNKKTSNDTIHIDYEQYSFAFQLHRWPKFILENYHTETNRHSQRKWPSKYHLNILIKKPLLLIPISAKHQWEVNFDLIEQNLFELMNEPTLYFYALCQQVFSPSFTIRTCVKHCFLNYCEKYGLPFSNNREHGTDSIMELMIDFLKEIHTQITEKYIPHYFNRQINLYQTTDNFEQWFDYIDQCLTDRIRLPSSSVTITNRPIIVEFLFHFIDQLYETFHIKRSQFHLNENVLLDLHRQVCDKLSNDTNNNSTSLQKFLNHLLNNRTILDHIQTNLTFDFESNAELVHTCLNQVRKADSSLIFHYTWTIYIQYLHTYYNVLWNNI